MSQKNKILAGLAGAVVLTLVHEVFRKNDPEAPRINEVATEGMEKLTGQSLSSSNKGTYLAALAGDLISNGIYFASAATPAKGNSFLTPLLSGLIAGTGGVLLPEKLGLNDNPVAGSDKKKGLTIGYYVIGALATTIAYKILDNRSRKSYLR